MTDNAVATYDARGVRWMKWILVVGSALVEVLVNRQELSLPPKINLEQVGGFALYLARAVLSGRGDEIVELAKTNIFR